TPEELDKARIESGRIFHFGSITLIDEPARTTTLTAVEIARSAGLLISYDPNLRPPLWSALPTARITILEAAHSADIVKVSEEELAFLMGAADILSEPSIAEARTSEYAAAFLQRFPNVALLAVTRGARGCAWWTAGGARGSLDGLRVAAVDTTG